MTNRLTVNIGIGLIVGVAVGCILNAYGQDHAAAKQIADYLSIVTDIFLRMIKMIIAPLIFVLLVTGLAGIGGNKNIGRLAFWTIGWFVGASFISLGLGLLLGNVLTPGAGLGLVSHYVDISSELKVSGFNLHDFAKHVFPISLFDALGRNEVLQIVVFALFFGSALGALRSDPRVRNLIGVFDAVAAVMLKVTTFVMQFAPIGVFTAIAVAVATHGLGVLYVYGKFVGVFYLGLALLIVAMILVGHYFLKGDIWTLLRAIREPALLAFSTASSDAAYPTLISRLESFGARKEVVGFVLPMGYSFNLDGTMMYCTLAALFISQAFGLHMSLGQQIVMLLVLLVSSKGAAGVPRGSIVIVAAVAPMFNLPPEGVLLILGMDQILDMGRTATNVIGNSIATAALDRLEKSRVEVEDAAVECAGSIEMPKQ